jgi:homogentisate 1,2-dioxygenase
MDAPYSHRDFRRPVFAGPLDEKIRKLVVKRAGGWHGFTVDASPLDVVGWGRHGLSVGRSRSARSSRGSGSCTCRPTWHGTFGARGALICSFVPRPLDFHPDAIPARTRTRRVVRRDHLLLRGNFTSRRAWAGQHLAPPGGRHARSAPRRL